MNFVFMLPFLATPSEMLDALFEGNIMGPIAFVLIFWYALWKVFDSGDLWP